jgi:hypothetical protein
VTAAAEDRRDVTAALRALVEATPPPPDGEPDGILAAFDVMIAARAEILARLAGAAVPGLEVGGQALVDELHRRDQAWLAALARTQGVVGDQLRAVRAAQRYER